ncbi:MAG: hypothetical protein LBL46_05045 [Rickettsiales bacterium]|jgi:medium-chain acyl-[acyl-carrier-protein] hydrolase|nr:hypothetical protein [Rickettsiales bacterium]
MQIPEQIKELRRSVEQMAGRLDRRARRMIVRLRRFARGKTPALRADKFQMKKRIATAEIARDGRMRPVSMMQELQAVADIHATLLGAGRAFCLSNNMTWVVTHYNIEILQMPDDKEELQFITWPLPHEALRAVRDFEVRGADGRPLIRASSQWIMIDLTTRRPVKLTEKLPEWNSLTERALDAPFDKMPDELGAQSGARDFDIRYDDIDVNQHVNNAVYVLWATESLGYDFLMSHKLRGLRINFKKEIPAGAARVSVAFSIAPAPSGGVATRHTIRTDSATHAVVECEWEVEK